MWDFVFCELLNFNYIAPAEVTRIILAISLALHVPCLLFLIICFFGQNGKFADFLEKGYNFFISKPFIGLVSAINALLILVASKREIFISLSLSGVILFVYSVLVVFLLFDLYEEADQYEF